MQVGRISGRSLRALAGLLRTPMRHVSAKVMRGQLGIDTARALLPEMGEELPLDQRAVPAREPTTGEGAALAEPEAPAGLVTGARLTQAYRTGTVTPEQVAQQALDAAARLADGTSGRNPIAALDSGPALAAARESTARFAAGTARLLEGVPVVVKEELDVAGLTTGMGAHINGRRPASGDSELVARLRAAGAVILGNTVMTQFGMSPLGANAHRDMPLNPHDAGCLAGGSSTGSGVAVALGLVPLAVGLDGGGSIRIPSALNGIFGIKPTFERVPTHGHGLPVGSSVVHAGPLGASTADLATFLQATCAEDGHAGEFLKSLGRGVSGMRIGVEEAEWAAADPEIARIAMAALHALEKEGAKLVPVSIPLAAHASAIGYMTIGLEEASAIQMLVDEGHVAVEPYMKCFLRQLAVFEAFDYVDAQRLRAGLRSQARAALQTADVIALPTTNCEAPKVTAAEMQSGFVDPVALDAVSRFSYLANLTGLPAGTAPVGAGGRGLPLGLQIIADAYDEAAVLQVSSHLERLGVARCAMPAGYLGGELLAEQGGPSPRAEA